MLPLAGAEIESTTAADREINARTQTRRQQQTCEQCEAACSGLDRAVSDICRRNRKQRPVEFRPVVLSEALQRNAKHEARLSNISDFCLVSAFRKMI